MVSSVICLLVKTAVISTDRLGSATKISNEQQRLSFRMKQIDTYLLRALVVAQVHLQNNTALCAGKFGIS